MPGYLVNFGVTTALDRLEAIEQIKLFVIENDLPKTDMGIFGIRCPYCGKSDRIRKLEPPDALTGRLNARDMLVYATLWHQLDPLDVSCLGVCRFCQNPLELFMNEGHAKTLDESVNR